MRFIDSLINKWYFSLLILPVCVNYLTDVIKLPLLFSNLSNTLIFTLAILVLILFFENKSKERTIQNYSRTPKEHDKRIIKELLETLDLEMFQTDIAEQDSWYGYKKEAIRKMIDFDEKQRLLKYKTSNEELNDLISKFGASVEDFQAYSSMQLYGNGDFYSPAKESDIGYKKAKEATPIMNEKSKIMMTKLSKLLLYLKEYNYLG